MLWTIDAKQFGRRPFEECDGESKSLVETIVIQAAESDSNSEFSDDDSEDVGALCDAIRQKHGRELQSKFPEHGKPVKQDVGIENIDQAIDQISRPGEESRKDKIQSCANCCRKNIVKYVSSFERGQHIRIPGASLTYDLGKELVSVYTHHAIVKEISKISGTKVELVLIHYTLTDEVAQLHIDETTETYDLGKDEIYIIEYIRPRYSQDEIVQRAESMMLKGEQNKDTHSKRKHFSKYDVFTRNCEHFATWCVVGTDESFQVQSFRKSVVRNLGKATAEGCKIARFVKRFILNPSHKIAAGFDIWLQLPGMFLGVTALVYLIYCCIMSGKHYTKYNNGEMCKSCFKREMSALWTSFGAFTATSGLPYVIVQFCLPALGPAGIPCLIALVGLAIAMQWVMPKLRKALLMPYPCDTKPISRLSDINVGDMISFKYFSISHNAIVTEVYTENDESTVSSIRYVHYGLKNSNIFGTREVIEEQDDLSKKQIKLVDCRHLKRYLPNQVVERVRKRVGERKWSPVSNRSDHLCFWSLVIEENDRFPHIAHTDDIGESQSKTKSSLCYGKKEVHLSDDLQPGDVVKYERKCRRNCDKNEVRKNKDKSSTSIGIVLKLKCKDEREFQMQLIVYENKRSKLETFNVDLKIDRLFIKNYHPAHCYSMEERVQRARKGWNEDCKYKGEDHFIESCLLKEMRNPSIVKVVLQKLFSFLSDD